MAEGLEVEAQFRHAVSAALDAAATAFAVDDAAPLLATKHHGTLGDPRRLRTAARLHAGRQRPGHCRGRERGGGSLTEAIRRDPQSEVTRLLERVVWVPDLGSAVQDGRRHCCPAGAA